MTTMPSQYYERFDSTQNYDEHLFRAGRGLQSAELNEIQKQAGYALKTVADAMFKDGDIIRDARCTVNETTGLTSCSSGALYIRGRVRGVAPRSFTIPIVGTIAIGIYLVETVVTEVEDPDLRDPATGTRNYNEAGAARLQVTPQWGYDGDGTVGEFYPVYEAVNGVLSPKEAPPSLDAFNQALARYDRDSTGGSYVVSGMTVKQLDDLVTGEQVFTISEGRARVNGYGIEFSSARRVEYDTAPDLRLISNEPKTSTTSGSQRINVDRPPLKNITEVSITAEKTVTMTHGVVTGAQDPLPDTSVLSIIEVTQGATTYVATTDYLLTAGKVDWSPVGNEPAPGSTYTVTYRYITDVTPTGIDQTGFTITGAVSGTLVLTTYNQMLPRVDRLCLDAEGQVVFLKGVAADYYPQPPGVPNDMLSLATINQVWTTSRSLVNDSVRMVSMPVLANIENRIDFAMQLIAQQRLESDIHMREAGTKKGLFTDPFLDDSQRDDGIVQTAAIVDGELTLPIAATVHVPDADITSPQTCASTPVTALQQEFKTGSMKINPYMAFSLPAAKVQIIPAVDRWTETETTWKSPITRRFTRRHDHHQHEPNKRRTRTDTNDVLVSSSTVEAETLRQIEVRFDISGFGPSEILSSVTFDGVEVTPLPV